MSAQHDAEALSIWTNISTQLGEISGQMKSVLSQLADHAYRIQQLEHHPSNQPIAIGKDSIVKYLVIALIGCIAIIATLTGSTAIVKAMLFNH